jgi:hypothetical protein
LNCKLQKACAFEICIGDKNVNILKFSSIALKESLLRSLNYFKETDNRWLYIEIDGLEGYENDLDLLIDFLEKIKSGSEKYSDEELMEYDWVEGHEVNEISEMTHMEVSLDSMETTIDCTINEFIELIYQAQNADIQDGMICYSDGMVVLRCETNDCEELAMYYSDFVYKGISVNMTISEYSDIYLLRLFFDSNFTEDFPLTMEPEIFIEINYDKESTLTRNDVEILYNAFRYNIFTSKRCKLELNPRVLEEYETFEGDEDYPEIEINERIFSKGINELISLFNQAEDYNLDRAIVEYVKVIEYVSATVNRKTIITELQKKLSEPDGEIHNADYVVGLVEIVENMKNNNRTDAEKIKNTIIECCDILAISEHSPQFIESLYNLENKINENRKNEIALKQKAFKDLCQSVSETRNNLSHAKANYKRKELECPDNEKGQFVILLKNICIQVIDWFYSTDENIRITNTLND